MAFAVLVGLLAWWRRAPELPEGLSGRIVYVSDRSGVDSLYVRSLPSGNDTRLSWLERSVAGPAIAPDGVHVAYSSEGRIETVHVITGDVAVVSLGSGWSDSQPGWRPDGRALVVVSRRTAGERSDLHLLELGAPGTLAARRPLTDTPGFDEVDPVFSPDGGSVVFSRQGGLFELDLEGGTTHRLATGFAETRAPRFLPDGAIVCVWSDGKRFGIDRLDAEHGRRTLHEGATAYRSVAPSPDGRYLVATRGLDLGFHLSELLKPHPTEELHLLDGEGRVVATLVSAWRHSNHSADWGR